MKEGGLLSRRAQLLVVDEFTVKRIQSFKEECFNGGRKELLNRSIQTSCNAS
jgi:hypothetical protein